MTKFIKKYLLIFVGSLSLTLGVIGMFLPVLPTTPFLLLAAYCYLRSSKRLYHWLINHKVFGAYIYNYVTHRAVLKRTKIIAAVYLWLALAVSIILVNNWPIRYFLLLVGCGISIHLYQLKTIDKDEMLPPVVADDSRQDGPITKSG
ncbi:MAG TPA: YbaN family protein [Peptococcaceae bacterium]|jgi:uncharacterized membrane protein YbaN (DUF454 family)|nr:DUF454 domain-containing protein [Clostridia bacterium]HOB82633.1 YbaN family protein [Peptococcaceae bacterium]HPZ71487.1 YbaN family protein [Peptococcaceae bacterium]HQD53739.1 YbaN family protein [Peptococcaceae bacterium]